MDRRIDESELDSDEKFIVCPKCGDEHCISGPAYDECQGCGYVSPHGKETCACCGAKTLEYRDHYEVCPLCGWEDDDIQNDDPDYRGGANPDSLNERRTWWAKQKASSLGNPKKAI
jgi:hypothetical protein